MKTHELKKMLKAAGCFFVRDGSRHDIWYSPLTGQEFPVWRYKGELKKGTAEAILKEAGLK